MIEYQLLTVICYKSQCIYWYEANVAQRSVAVNNVKKKLY